MVDMEENMDFDIVIHSATDRITNSSTVIYTDSSDSPAAFEEMVDEMFDTFGVKERCADVFTIEVVKEKYTEDTMLKVTTKDNKYKKLATLMVNFLYSTDHRESYND